MTRTWAATRGDIYPAGQMARPQVWVTLIRPAQGELTAGACVGALRLGVCIAGKGRSYLPSGESGCSASSRALCLGLMRRGALASIAERAPTEQPRGSHRIVEPTGLHHVAQPTEQLPRCRAQGGCRRRTQSMTLHRPFQFCVCGVSRCFGTVTHHSGNTALELPMGLA